MTTSLFDFGRTAAERAGGARGGLAGQASPAVNFMEQFNIPTDLSEWLGRKRLAGAVTEVTHSVNEQLLQPVFSLNNRRLFHPWALLSLVTYSYAVGIYGSEEIAHRLMHDETFHVLFSHECWDAGLIRRFRDLNRDLIQQCLEKVCLLAWAEKFGSTAPPPAAAAEEARPLRAHPLFKIQMICDVRTRVHCAEQADLLAAA